jgi:hypothetical protein
MIILNKWYDCKRPKVVTRIAPKEEKNLLNLFIEISTIAVGELHLERTFGAVGPLVIGWKHIQRLDLA